MVKPLALLKYIGVAVLKAAVKAVPLGEVVADLAQDVFCEWSKEKKAEERRADLEEVAKAAAENVRAQVREIVREIAGNQPKDIQQTITDYLDQVPAAIHRTLGRPTDPTGTTIPPTLEVCKPEDLLPFLPTKLPRFKAGDRPAGIGDWELVELLGIGGFGEVWKARNPHFDGMAPVALKFCLDAAARDRLLKHEAGVLNQVMRQGKHEGIVPLLHTYLNADPSCLAYEYIDGGDLAGLIQERRGGLSAQQAARVIQRLAEIVGFAHRLNPPIVHRDLKPANILVKSRPDGKLALRITDFGIGGLAIQEAVAQSRTGRRAGSF